jgi:hypothetical protein
MSDFTVLIPMKEPEEHSPVLGEGLSRPKKTDKTSPITVMVKIPGARVMRWTVSAPSPKAALSYAQNRWPHAHVFLPPKD